MIVSEREAFVDCCRGDLLRQRCGKVLSASCD